MPARGQDEEGCRLSAIRCREERARCRWLPTHNPRPTAHSHHPRQPLILTPLAPLTPPPLFLPPLLPRPHPATPPRTAPGGRGSAGAGGARPAESGGGGRAARCLPSAGPLPVPPPAEGPPPPPPAS